MAGRSPAPAPDPAIVRSPAGDEIDGRRLLAEAVGFGRALREAGLSIDLGAAVDYARALTLVDLGQRETVRRVETARAFKGGDCLGAPARRGERDAVRDQDVHVGLGRTGVRLEPSDRLLCQASLR